MNNLDSVNIFLGSSIDDYGRVSLTDIYKYAYMRGQAKQRHKPGQFLRSLKSKMLIEEFGHDSVSSVRGGDDQGTFASVEIAIEYLVFIYGQKARAKILECVSDYNRVFDAIDKFEVPDDLPDMYVYAIRNEHTKNIKIGISRNPEKRLEQLQIGNDCKLSIVAVKKAVNRFKDEKYCHALNNDKRISGEWFLPDAKI